MITRGTGVDNRRPGISLNRSRCACVSSWCLQAENSDGTSTGTARQRPDDAKRIHVATCWQPTWNLTGHANDIPECQFRCTRTRFRKHVKVSPTTFERVRCLAFPFTVGLRSVCSFLAVSVQGMALAPNPLTIREPVQTGCQSRRTGSRQMAEGWEGFNREAHSEVIGGLIADCSLNETKSFNRTAVSERIVAA